MRNKSLVLLLLPLLLLTATGSIKAVDQTWSLSYSSQGPKTLLVAVNIDAVSPQPSITGALVRMAYDHDVLTLDSVIYTGGKFANWEFLNYNDNIPDKFLWAAGSWTHSTAGPGTAFWLKFIIDDPYDINSYSVWMTVCSTRINDLPWVAYSPPVPTLIAPANGASVTDVTPLFDWSETVEPVGTYTLQYSTSASFGAGTETVSGIADDQYEPTVPLSPNTYYWHVSAFGGCGVGSAYSATRSFTVMPCPTTPAAPTVSINPVCANTQYCLSWPSVQYADRYEIRLGAGSWQNLGNTNQYCATQTAAGNYEYRLRACNSQCGCSDASTPVTV